MNFRYIFFFCLFKSLKELCRSVWAEGVRGGAPDVLEAQQTKDAWSEALELKMI